MKNIPRIHDFGHPRRDSKNSEKYSVNLSISTAGSTKIQKNVFRILLKFRSVLAGFLAVVGHSWDLDQKRHGTRPFLINQTEIGTELQE